MIRHRYVLFSLTVFMALIVSGPVFGQDTQASDSVNQRVQPEADAALRQMGQLQIGRAHV